jgi:hypothetical protein
MKRPNTWKKLPKYIQDELITWERERKVKKWQEMSFIVVAFCSV